MSDPSLSVMADRASRLQLDIIQVHSDPSPDQLAALRSEWSGGVWGVVRGADLNSPSLIAEMGEAADAVLIDSGPKGGLGGTGVPLPWRDLDIPDLANCMLVLAGGLTPENVAEAIDAIRPGVVDVVSGVESLPGIKDWSKMDAFMAAVRHAGGA
jgi:phosphoribosylanthranilate isomerase